MTIGYLHIGAATHGVARYGRMLAAAAREHLETDVQEVEAHIDGVASDSKQQLREAARQLSAVDVVHLQYNERVWGNAHAAANVRTFVGACTAPLVVTLHDVRHGYGWRDIVRRVWARRRARTADARTEGAATGAHGDRRGGWLASLRRALRYVWKEGQNTRATRRLVRRAGRVLVCTHAEADRLHDMVPAERLTVLPHFVEERSLSETSAEAKAVLRLAGSFVCTVLGFIHRAKGHALVVEALPQCPENVQVVFAGRPAIGSKGFVEQLRTRAEALGVADRLRITGYLAEPSLNRYLAATDLALCPFEEVSASGSLSTWIAAGRPILASEQPQIAEYNAMAPGAIATFSPYTPSALADAVRVQLQGRAASGRRARTRLREKLSLPRIIRRHAGVYRQVIEQEIETAMPHESE